MNCIQKEILPGWKWKEVRFGRKEDEADMLFKVGQVRLP